MQKNSQLKFVSGVSSNMKSIIDCKMHLQIMRTELTEVNIGPIMHKYPSRMFFFFKFFIH